MRMWSVAVLLVSTVALAQPKQPPTVADLALEKQFRAEVAAVSAHAAAAFDRGTAARDANKLDEALAAYREAEQAAPNVDHPHRRVCGILMMLGRVAEAVPDCERATQLAPESPFDAILLAQVLTMRHGNGDSGRALELARAAHAKLPDDVALQTTACSVFAHENDGADADPCIEHLLAIAPDSVAANYLGAIAAAANGRWTVARDRLAEAKAHGLDDATYQALAGKLDEAERGGSSGHETQLPSTDVLWLALWVLAGWLGAMGVLLVSGYALSRATLRAAARVATARASAGTGTAHERRLRAIYKVVLATSGIYFYVSIPILVAVIAIAGFGAIYVFIAMGTIPVKLVLIIGIVVLGTISAIVRSLFARGVKPDLGDRIDLDREPKLKALISEVAETVGTRPADAVYITPGVDMSVSERVGLWGAVRGKRVERSLVMGLGLFEGMTQIQLRSVLAHEHGHFRNADTAGGGFALVVRRSLFSMIVRIARAGVAGNFNPVWWFLRAYHRIYLNVSQGASRLQEVLADRWAIQAYGSAAFVAGYRHIVSRSVRFEREANAALDEVIRTKRALPNLYNFHPAKPPDEQAALDAIDKELAREPTAYDSHPSSKQRIEWAEALAAHRDPAPGDDDPIWALFENRTELEAKMTAVVRERIRVARKIAIPAQEPAAGT